MQRLDELGFLTALYGGQHQTPRWGGFLKDLQRHTRADTAHLLFCQGAARLARATAWPATEPASFGVALDGLRPSRVYAFDELDRLTTAGAPPPYGRAIRVGHDGVWSAWLIVTRDQSDFTAADGVQLSVLAPHLTIAMQTFAAMERLRLHADIAQDLLARCGVTWLLVDETNHIIEDERTPAPQKDIEHAVAKHAASESDAAINIRRAQDAPSVGLISTTAAHPSLAASPGATRVLTIRTQTPLGAKHARQFEHLWSLSPSEARLTVTLANGASLTEAAAKLGLTTETVRNYSKRIYAKTGANGLADLVRMALSSVATLA
jgi:DNA-binding CsgD family transcriptional regulator